MVSTSPGISTLSAKTPEPIKPVARAGFPHSLVIGLAGGVGSGKSLKPGGNNVPREVWVLGAIGDVDQPGSLDGCHRQIAAESLRGDRSGVGSGDGLAD